jgi:hypothetical protein
MVSGRPWVRPTDEAQGGHQGSNSSSGTKHSQHTSDVRQSWHSPMQPPQAWTPQVRHE